MIKYNPETYIDLAYLQGQLLALLDTKNKLQEEINKKEKELKKAKKEVESER
tara:strand:- start:273 stop:428 length:156 start_codon:yes stop_codon:yes gene_type:complete